MILHFLEKRKMQNYTQTDANYVKKENNAKRKIKDWKEMYH